ncbi:hypothetical protein [Streptomyces sp. NPDC093089]|uniref:hypothetical protein n=1 Tax=Streptomyces sp. NPDC093089 TaxID=3366024 RepID=UPI00382949BE
MGVAQRGLACRRRGAAEVAGVPYGREDGAGDGGLGGPAHHDHRCGGRRRGFETDRAEEEGGNPPSPR